MEKSREIKNKRGFLVMGKPKLIDTKKTVFHKGMKIV